MTLPRLLRERRSTKEFARRPIDRTELAAVVWAAQGQVDDGRRTCPSAHARYPLSLTVVAGAVTGQAPGILRYDSASDALTELRPGDRRAEVAAASLVDGEWLRHAAAVLVLGADLRAADAHFADQAPDRGRRYAWLEAGCAAQNAGLRAAELGLGAVLVGGIDDDAVRALALLPPGHDPLALIGLGHPL